MFNMGEIRPSTINRTRNKKSRGTVKPRQVIQRSHLRTHHMVGSYPEGSDIRESDKGKDYTCAQNSEKRQS